ncbi:MAG: HAD-IA family hydrolase [Pseudomonadota bacterium]
MTSALLFDLDGTLVDTDSLHFAVFHDILAGTGRALSLDEYKTEIMGQPNALIMPRLFPGRDAEHQALADAKEAAFRAQLSAGLEPTPGTRRLLDWAEAEGVRVAVVTNAPRSNAEAMLGALDLSHRFETVIIGEECARPKPDPLPYQEAMQRLGTTPSRSIAFEDSRSGARAAVASGAYTFGMRTGLDDATLRSVGVHATLADFDDPLLWARLAGFPERHAS